MLEPKPAEELEGDESFSVDMTLQVQENVTNKRR
jgi:hypothetical protein